MEYYLPPVMRGQPTDVQAQSLPWHITDLQVDKYWERTGGGHGIRVGVCDTGIDEDHPDIAGRIDYVNCFCGRNGLPKRHYDGHGHGTHVATTIAKMAPKASFAIAKVLRDNGSGTNRDIAEGIDWCVEMGCHIINLSLGGPSQDGRTLKAIQNAQAKGCLVIAATGNEAAGSVCYPARDCIAVGAVDRNRKLAYFSNRGTNVDLVGFGVEIVAGIPGGRWQPMSGTSMATPWVAAIAALRLSAERATLGEVYTNSNERALELETFVTDLGPEGKDTSYGRGLPDLEKVLNIQPPAPEPPAKVLQARLENPATDEVWLGNLYQEKQTQ